MTMAVRIHVTDRNLAPVGGPVAGWTDLDVTVRHMTAGGGTFSVAAKPATLEQLAAGHRIVVMRRAAAGLPWRYFAHGPIEGEPGEWDWQAARNRYGSVVVPFSTDEAHVVERITYPDPTQPATAQTASATRSLSGDGETVMRTLVDENAGPGALTARQAPGLVLGAVAGVGGTVSVSTRFQPLGDVLRTVGLAAGGLGWRVRQDGTQLLFEVFAPRDLTGRVRFSRGHGNLRRFRYTPKSPTCTAAIVGGQGEGAARTIRERINADAVARWRRIERFVDKRQTADVAELDQAGDEALTEGAEQVGLEAEVVETSRQRFGEQWGLGDRVAVELASGAVVADVVTSAQLLAHPRTGDRVLSAVGSRPQSSDLDWLAEARRLRRRLANLEAI